MILGAHFGRFNSRQRAVQHPWRARRPEASSHEALLHVCRGEGVLEGRRVLDLRDRDLSRRHSCAIEAVQGLNSVCDRQRGEFITTWPTVPPLHADMHVPQGNRLSSEQMDICDHFVYVPQYGGPSSPVHSLSTIVALSICLQHFGTFASYPTRAFEDTFARGKFILDEVVHITGRTEAGDKVAEKRRQERESREAEMGGLGGGPSADY